MNGESKPGSASNEEEVGLQSKTDLITRRVSSHLAVPGGSAGTDPGDLALMETAGQFTLLAVTAPTGRGPTRWIRRALYRLLYPLLQQQTNHAEATARLVTQLVSRVNVIERRTSEGDDAGERNLSVLDCEGEFRGSEEQVRERQRQYIELFVDRSPVLDVGCGRGEFLGLLEENGIAATGVDLDLDMVERCRSLGYQVVRGDGLAHMRSLGPGTLGGIFCAQVIEHLTPADLISFAAHAARTLRPGGVLLVETINPRSFAGLTSFFVDLGHVRPYDASSIAHLLATSGFVSIGKRFLYPDAARDAFGSALKDALGHSEAITGIAADVADKLYGSHNYAVWGYRPAS